MSGNSFGKLFRITTFGESHGKLVGVVIDGVPAGLKLSEKDIEFELQFRKPGRLYVSPRKEEDKPIIVSGLFNNRTTGAPITVIVENKDVKPEHYEEIHYMPRPTHADIPYIIRYGYENWDYRGGGRASARETLARVIAGAIAKKLLMLHDTIIAGHLKSLGNVSLEEEVSFEEILLSKLSPVRACNKKLEKLYEEMIMKAMKEGDSYGGIVEVVVKNPPIGLGEPVFDKLKADLAKALLSIPAAIGFEYGIGFKAAYMKGSELIDEVYLEGNRFRWRKNYFGGILGGISTGEDIILRCAFRPASSVRIPQKTVDLRNNEPAELLIKGRHDPAIAIRAVAVVEAMVAIVLADHALRSNKINQVSLSNDEAEKIEARWIEYMKKCGAMQGSQ